MVTPAVEPELRMRELLAPLMQDASVRLYLRIEVNRCGGESDPADLVFPIVFSPDFDRGPYWDAEPKRPATVAELRSELFRVNVPPTQMTSFLQMMLTTDFAYLESRGPLSQQEAESIGRRVVELLGPMFAGGVTWIILRGPGNTETSVAILARIRLPVIPMIARWSVLVMLSRLPFLHILTIDVARRFRAHREK